MLLIFLVTVTNVKKKWWNIRDGFIKCRKKQKVSKSRDVTSKLKKYLYSNQLQFLINETKESPSDKTLEVTVECTSQEERNEIVENFKKPRLGTRKRKLDPAQLKMITFLEEIENRHMSFFKGIIPSLNNFDEDQTIQFQMDVLQLISNIKREKSSNQQQVGTTSHSFRAFGNLSQSFYSQSNNPSTSSSNTLDSTDFHEEDG